MSAFFPCVHLEVCCGWAGCVQNCKLLKVHGVRLAVTAVCDVSCLLSHCPRVLTEAQTSSLALERYEGGCIKGKLAMPGHLRSYLYTESPMSLQ